MPNYSTPERREEGQLRRKQIPRQDHGKIKIPHRDPIALLEASARGRVPSLVALKYQLMSASAFGFFRGAAPIMAYDLSTLPNTGIAAQLCGDAHVRNFGAFASPDGRLVFDINDFDETTRGPFEWDVKRLATSLVLAGIVSRQQGLAARAGRPRRGRYLSPDDRHARQNAGHRSRTIPGAWSTPCRSGLQGVAQGGAGDPATHARKPDRPAHRREDRQAGAGERVFKENKPMLTRVTGAKAREVLASLKEYSESLLPERRHFLSFYRPIDVAFKVVGTGSVGLRDYVVYFEGNGPGDPLFLQIKEEAKSAYEPYLGFIGPRHQGQRVAEGQRAHAAAVRPIPRLDHHRKPRLSRPPAQRL